MKIIHALVLAFACTAFAGDSGGPLRPVALPSGATRLADIGIYRVFWQSYGKPEHAMPNGWTGYFTPDSGIAYLPGRRILGRPAILIHSPWRVAPGRTAVQYRLALPAHLPIHFKFGIAMRPDVAVPGKSDGVTFSVWLDAGRGPRKLMRRFWDQGRWQDYDLDLTPYAGKTVTLRLQVEPGPRNDPGFDFSYFGDPRILCGNAASSAKTLLTAFLDSPARRATNAAPLTRLANRSDTGVLPSNLLEHYSATVQKIGPNWRFHYRAADADIVWTWRPRTGTLDDFSVRVNGCRPFRPMAGGGLFFAGRPFGHARIPARGGHPDRVQALAGGRGITVRWTYPFRGRRIPAVWAFRLCGKALAVRVSSPVPRFVHFSLGSVQGVPFRRPVKIPYLPFGKVVWLPGSGVFAGRCLDWTVSNSSRCPAGEAEYDCRTDGRRNPVRESGYVAVSPCLDETLPNLPNPPSPYRAVLGPRIMLDVWSLPGNSFAGEADNLRTLKDHGVDHLAVIIHVWQRYGYDVKLPDHIPANPRYGGDDGLCRIGRAANDCGFRWAVHENYIDFYPDAPSYDPADRVLREDGSPSPAWFNRGTGVQSFGLKCNRAEKYARRNSPYIHRVYHTTAAYLDVHTCVPPWHQLDHEAGQPFAAMERGKVFFDSRLFQFMRDTHHGPLFGEGHHQAYWAGRCDGVEAQVEGGENHAPLLDFDLLKIHPQMVNHGMGYYERWFHTGYQTRWGRDAATPEQIDKYRAQEIAYGHAGFIGNLATSNIQWVAKEHHLMYPLQRLYTNARVTDIRYEVMGKWLRAGAAAALGRRLRQKITYDNGLTLWINWAPTPWNVHGRLLPQWGFLGLGPGTEVWTANVGKFIADWAECPEFLFADARTAFSMPYLESQLRIEPHLARFTPLGPRKFRVAYRWTVDQDIHRTGHCFVHFTNPAAGHGEEILFQQDHALPRPTSTWREGDRINDGPYDVALPETLPAAVRYFDILIGIYGPGGRWNLRGPQIGNRRILIGRVSIRRDGAGHITGLHLDDIRNRIRALRTDHADFHAHLNPPGTWIDFGKLATNGCIKVQRGPQRLTVYPYPDGRKISVALDLRALAPRANPATVQVHAVEKRSGRNLGSVPIRKDGRGRILFEMSVPNAVPYQVTW